MAMVPLRLEPLPSAKAKPSPTLSTNLLTAPPKSDVQCVLHNSYLQLLSLVSSIDSQVDSTHLQFMVVGVGGYNSDVPSTVTLFVESARTVNEEGDVR
ncbi:hypothetical protein ACQEVM_37260 [Streptomyces sp. CA-243310]|uniref:hypothetical protein n=1 Tax=Streptomyces sp. CA-243310 TaxID=3240056 RepID=UPI003D8DBE86